MTKGAVVTGGAGFLGSQLDLRLPAEDIEAVCLDEPLTHGGSAGHHPRPAGHGLTAAQRGRAGFEAADGRVVPRVPPSDCTLNSCRDVSIIWATRA